MAAARKAKPFFARADELEVHEPIVAYFCRVHGIEMIMKARQAGQSDPESDAVMMAVFEKAEEAKKSSNVDPAICQDVVEAFAVKVFDNTDYMDRSGMTDASTASQFYVASIFLDVCAQFYGGEMPPDLGEKSRYAKFRAVQIRDCVKKGLPLAPAAEAEDAPAAAGEEGTAAAAAPPPLPPPSNAPASGFQAYVAPSAQPAPGMFAPSAQAAAPPATGFQAYVAPAAAPAGYAQPVAPAAPVAAPMAPAVLSAGGGGGAAPEKVKADAKKKAEFAASALDFGDTANAQKYLQEALQLLQNYDR